MSEEGDSAEATATPSESPAESSDSTDEKSSVTPPESNLKLSIATKDDDTIWRDGDGIPLPVSASDLERHAYCPLSWQLAKSGVAGEGEAIERGNRKHDEIHKAMENYHGKEQRARREMVIWTWWFAILATFAVDTAAFFFVGEGMINEDWTVRLSRYLALLSLTWLLLAILLLFIPWRRMIGAPFGLAQPPNPVEFDLLDEELIEIGIEVAGDGGWLKGGRMEFWLLLGSLTIALHSLALYAARERSVATFVLLVATVAWTFVAAWRLHRGLLASTAADEQRELVDIDEGGILAYSDDSIQSDLLTDGKTGLRGRPDQILIIENKFVPVEQKTGKIPIEPHFSHRLQVLAYLKLVSELTNTPADYGILRYGKEALHRIDWDDAARHTLMENISEIQRLMVEGGAARNHERPGKCRNCSRRHRCHESLV